MERKKINWSKWVHLFGVISDEEIAKKIGCTPATVWYHRTKLNIPASHTYSRIDWEKWDHILGTMHDADAAKQIRCSASAAQRRRSALGMPPCKKSSESSTIDWTKWDHILGVAPDTWLSREIGCSVKTVGDRRKSLGISPSKKGPIRGGNKYTRSTAIDWSKWDHLLGSIPDSTLAEKIKCTRAAVHLRRKAFGIPSNRERLKKTTLRPRTCRTDLGGCGRTFQGGPRAWFCPECREERAKETNRRYRLRKAKGLSRVLGDEDFCEVCGGPYAISGSLQRYCPSCAPDAIKENDAQQGLEYYRKNADTINPARNRKRRKERPGITAICAREECGKPFVKFGPAIVCPECRPEWRRQRQKEMDAKRRGKDTEGK